MTLKSDASQINFNILFKNHPLPMWIYDLQSLVFLEVNDAAVKTYGYSRKNFLSMTLNDIRPKEDVSKSIKEVSKKRYAVQQSGNRQHKLKSGKIIDVEITSHELKYSGHNSVIETSRDITDQKLAEEKLKLTQFGIDQSHIGIFQIGEDGKINYANEQACKSLGYTYKELTSLSVVDIDPTFTLKKWKEHRKNIRKKGSSTIETIHKTKNGKEFFVEVSINFFDYGGKKISFSFAKDITERKKAEQQIHESEKQLRKLVEGTRALVFTTDHRGRFTYFNLAGSELLGIPPNQLLGSFYLRLVHPDDRKRVHQQYLHQLETANENTYLEFRYIGKNRKVGWLGFSVNTIVSNGNIIGLTGVAQEITERKHAEKALRENETQYRSIVENLHQAYYEADSRSIFTYCNPELIIISGYTEQKLIGMSSFRLVAEEHRTRIAETYRQWKKEKRTDMSVEFLVQKKNGEKIWVEQTSHCEFDEQGYLTKAENIVRDIHERKLAEDDLRKSEDRYRQLFENSPIGIYRTTPDGRILAANPALVRMLGYSLFEDFAHRNLEQEPDTSYSRSAFKEQLDRDGFITGLEVEWYKSDNTPLFVRENAQVVRDEKGRVLYYDGTVEDITEFKKAEVALRENEERLRTIIETEPECVKVVDRDGRLLEMNAAGLAMLEAESLSEAQQHTLFNFILPEYHAAFDALHKRVMSGENGILEFEVTGLNGTRRWLETHAAPMRNATGEVAKLLGVTRDITERKRAEEALRESETKLQVIIESTADGILAIDQNGKVIKTNKRFVELWQIPPTILDSGDDDKLINFVIDQLIDPEQFVSKVRLLYNSKDEDFDTLFFKDGRTFERYSAPLFLGDNVLGRVWSFSDITERKRAEETLHESEERFRNLVESINEVFYITNKEGKITYCSPNITSATGFALKEILGNSFLRLIAPIDRRLVMDHYIELNTNGGSDTMLEFRVGCKDGKIIWAEQITHIVRDTSGGVVEYRNVTRDITERKKAEELLRKSQEDLLKFFEDDLSADYISTPAGLLLNCNKTYLNVFGFKSKEEALAFSLDKIYPASSSRKVFIDLLKKNNKVENLEGEYVTHDGRIIYTIENAVAEFDKAGELTQIRGYIVDITERKLAEEELKKLSRAVEQSPVSVIITNKNGDIEYVNEKFCKVTGYSKVEAIGKNPQILKSGYHDQNFYSDFWNHLLSGKEWIGEMRNKKKSGELFWESVLVSSLINNEGNISHFVAVKEDITDKKIMVDELIMAKDKAESSNRLKDAFIANMSHEIRTPLNGILGLSSIIKSMYAAHIKEEDESIFAGVEHSSKRLIRTIDMILNYSRVQIGEFPINPMEVELSLICENLVSEFAVTAKNKLLELSFENRSEKAITIFGDEYSITHSISNLIDNSIKYTDKGFIKIILHIGNSDEILLDITDSGIGISKEYLTHIFEPYQQEHMGYGRAYEGVGLGLSMVKKFLNLNNADIFVKSERGSGTTFTINFGKSLQPSVKKIIDKKIDKIITGHAAQEKPLVLLVEDDVFNQAAIKIFIENKYNTIITDSSEGAIEIMNNNKIDIVLMDISIKGSKNGLELTKEFKSSKEYSKIPVVAITAHAFESDRLNALEAGCDDYLSKPFSRALLLEKIDKYF